MLKELVSFLVVILWSNGMLFAQEGNAEKVIDKTSIYNYMLNDAQPQGIVDENSPWLHFRVPVASSLNIENIDSLDRRYYFELSQDSLFKTGVIKSKPKKWSFYNPYRILEKGVWFWRYGLASSKSPAKITWSEKVYTFSIKGNERQMVYPTPEQLLERVASTKGPHVVMLPEDIGKLMPESHPEIKKRLLNEFEKELVNGTPIKVIVDTCSIPKHLKGDQKRRYLTLNALKQFTDLADRVRLMLNAYLLTGDLRYKKLGLDSFYALDNEYRTTMMQYAKRPGFPDDFVVEQHTKTMVLILDAFGNDLTDDWRGKIVDLLFTIKKEGYLSYYKQLEFSEHVVYKAHLWQMCVYTLLSSSIVLSPYNDEAKIWMEYAYELWLYRNPAGSRNDGAWYSDNGYFGANERQLVFTPILLGKLMKFNYFNHPWYRNVAKYLTYSTPYGNPGVAFGDATGYNGSHQSALVEVLGHIDPDNYWNLWRLRSWEDKVGSYGKFNLANESIWSLLLVWDKFSKPNLANVQSPKDMACLFNDVGYVGMHTNLDEPHKNLFVNFKSSPFGQFNHSHPAQNAFNVSYGSEPLFWRTGHYATATSHQVFDYKNTRAHNCILADGMGQACDLSGYGWIARFVTGSALSYALGDASNAYSGIDVRKGSKFERQTNIEMSERTGFGNPDVKRFRRHIAMLRPHFVVIYDELEAEKPIIWTFNLHALYNMQKHGENSVCTQNKFASADAYLFCADQMKTLVSDRFLAEPIDVQGKRNDGKETYPNQWHASFETIGKVPKTRFLTIIEITPTGEVKKFKPTVFIATGLTHMTVGDYTVIAQLDPSKPSYLEIFNQSQTCKLVTGQASKAISLGIEKKVAKVPGSTLFLENNDGGFVFEERVDQLPDAVLYGNQY